MPAATARARDAVAGLESQVGHLLADDGQVGDLVVEDESFGRELPQDGDAVEVNGAEDRQVVFLDLCQVGVDLPADRG